MTQQSISPPLHHLLTECWRQRSRQQSALKLGAWSKMHGKQRPHSVACGQHIKASRENECILHCWMHQICSLTPHTSRNKAVLHQHMQDRSSALTFVDGVGGSVTKRMAKLATLSFCIMHHADHMKQ